MYCEICGRPIEGDPIPVEVDKAVLYVCRSCAARYGKKAPQPAPQRPKPQPKPKSAPPPPPRELELVDNFGEVIRRARENLGLSREALAAMLGVKETLLRRIESGQLMPDISMARKLEKTLGVRLLEESVEAGGKEAAKVDRGALTLGEVAEIRENGED